MRKLIFLWVFSLSNILWAQQQKTFYFDSDQDQLNEPEKNEFQKWMTEKERKILVLQGFCDSTHHVKYNRDLALRRIHHIQKLATNTKLLGVNDAKIEVFGEEFELNSNHALNRKVVVLFEDVLKITPENQPIENDEVISEKVLIEASIKTYETTLNDFETQLASSVVGTKISLFDIHFEFNSAKMVESNNEYLNLLVNYLILNPETHIKIIGHMCCNKNATIKLSEKRARYIYHYLIQRNIDKKRLSYEGKGVSEPIFKIPEAHLQQQKTNRRVEIEITKK